MIEFDIDPGIYSALNQLSSRCAQPAWGIAGWYCCITVEPSVISSISILFVPVGLKSAAGVFVGSGLSLSLISASQKKDQVRVTFGFGRATS